jgi:hypothetical protein
VSLRATSLLPCVFLAIGCGAAAEPLTAGPRDYALYRRTRTATSSEGRLSASHDYLERMPDGRWRKEVESWFSRAEPVYFSRSKQSIAGLEAYMRTLPNGPHAKEASGKLADVVETRRLERARDARLLDEAREVEDKLADAADMRHTVTRDLTEWVARLAAIRSFGQPTSALASDTIYHFRLEEPGGHCKGDRCVKSLSLPFAIPANKRLVPRTALFDVVIELDRGGVARAGLAGPELWNRLAEASELRAVAAEDKQARAEAIARSVQIVSGALGPAFGEASCVREPVSPVVLFRQCRGVRITMRAAATPAEDDDFFVEPVPGT